jgi:hypothetical protein
LNVISRKAFIAFVLEKCDPLAILYSEYKSFTVYCLPKNGKRILRRKLRLIVVENRISCCTHDLDASKDSDAEYQCDYQDYQVFQRM